MYEEVDALMSKSRVDMHKIKPCSRKYAFELPDVPKEADYLKLLYPYASRLVGASCNLFNADTLVQSLPFHVA